MLSPDLIESNKKLDEQLIKLRECKSEMLKMFHDLDNMIDTSAHSSFCYYSQSSLNKSYSKLYEISSSESNYSNSDPEYDSDFYESSECRQPYRRPSLKFSFKFPLKNDYENVSTYSSFAPNQGKKYNYDQFARTSSTRPFEKSKNRSSSSLSRTKFQTRINSAIWKPSGRVMSKSAIFSSSHNISKPNKRVFKDTKDVGKGWMPTLGKSKEDLRIYSSSSYDKDPFKNVTVKKKIVTDPKDIGKGWKSILAKPKDHLKIYARSEPEREPYKTVVVRKKVIKDPDDIRKDKIPRAKNRTPIRSFDDVKEPFKSVTVKRMVFKDEKDVGAGWKPICYKTKDDLKKLYEQPEIPLVEKRSVKINKSPSKEWKPNGRVKQDNPYKSDFVLSTENNTNEKKKTKEFKCAGKEWKPSGKVKQDNPYKSDFVLSTENNTNEKKKTKEFKCAGKEWKPNGRVKQDNPYKSNEERLPISNNSKKESKTISKPPVAKANKPKPKLNLKAATKVKQDDDHYKTSTPNISKKIEDNDLNESIIPVENDDSVIEHEEDLDNKSNSEKSKLDADDNFEAEEHKKSEDNGKTEHHDESVVSKQSNFENDICHEEEVSNSDSQSKKSQNEKQPLEKEVTEQELSNQQENLNLEEEKVDEENNNVEKDENNEKETDQNSEIQMEPNEPHNKSENLNNDELNELNELQTPKSENLQVNEDNDENKLNDNIQPEIDEEIGEENETQLWKAQESDDE